MSKNIVITKTGCLSPYGLGVEEFVKNIQSQRIPEYIKIFDVSGYKVKKAFVMNDFDPKLILGEKGLRNFNRNTLLIISTIKDSMQDDLVYFKGNNLEIGLSIGSAFGSLQSISDYEFDIFAKGPKKINPMGFGNTVVNSPTSRANIWFDLTSQSSTISCGGLSSAKSVEFSIHQINDHKIDAMICGGSEELNMQTFLGYYLNNFLTKEDYISSYDKKSTGTILSEGCGLVLLETAETAKRRNTNILAEILGYSNSFYYNFDSLSHLQTRGIVTSINNTLDNAKVAKNQIDLIISTANGLKNLDTIEEMSLIEVFGDDIYNIPIIPIKSIIGEGIGSANVFQFILAANIKKIEHIDCIYMYSKIEKKLIKQNNFKINYSNLSRVLLNCCTECGNNSSFVLKI